jgi:hypothetical protein
MLKISNPGQPTGGGPQVWVMGGALTTCYEMLHMASDLA